LFESVDCSEAVAAFVVPFVLVCARADDGGSVVVV
jgi:hypothetical protein